MAIKISGNTIIDDSRNLFANTITATTFTGNAAGVTLPEFFRALKPTNVSPADGAIEVSKSPTLQITNNFQSTTGSTHANTQFQVSIDSGFSNTEVDIFTGANTTVVVPSILDVKTEHFFRARFFDSDGCCSDFSLPTSFTTVDDPFGTFGNSVCGGFYMGTIGLTGGSCYYLVMAPNATGCASCNYRTGVGCSNVFTDGLDGYGDTYDHLANSTHPAGNWTATRTIDGFSDWYLPASGEINQLYNNKACAPAGEGFGTGTYWVTNEIRAADASGKRFSDGSFGTCIKYRALGVRAIRRVPFY